MTSKTRDTKADAKAAVPAAGTETPHPAAGEQTVPVVVAERRLYKIPEAMRLLSMSRSVIYEQMRAGRLRYVKQGSSTLIPALAINEYVQLLICESEVEHD